MSVSISGVGGSASQNMVSGASMQMPPQQKMSNLFNAIDASGAGSISESQFNQAFETLKPPAAFTAAGPSSVWNSLDPKHSGQVSRHDFVNGMKDLMAKLRENNSSVSSAADTSTTGTQDFNNLFA